MKCYGQAAHTHTGVGHEISARDKGTMTLTIHGRWPWANLCVLFLQIRIWKRIVGGKGNSKLSSISAHAEMAAVYEAKTDECEEGEALLQSDQCATTQSRRGTTASFPNHTFWRVPPGTSLFSYSSEGSPAVEQGMSHYHSLTSLKCPHLAGGPQNHPEE